MKRILVLVFAVFIVTGICFAADPVEGYWLSIDRRGRADSGWHIYEVGGKLFGEILSMSDKTIPPLAYRCKDSYLNFPIAGDVSQMPLLGTPWIFGLTSTKTGEWDGGYIVNAEDGKQYRCRITYRPADGKKFKKDVLEMRGILLRANLGRSVYWEKTDEHGASSL